MIFKTILNHGESFRCVPLQEFLRLRPGRRWPEIPIFDGIPAQRVGYILPYAFVRKRAILHNSDFKFGHPKSSSRSRRFDCGGLSTFIFKAAIIAATGSGPLAWTLSPTDPRTDAAHRSRSLALYCGMTERWVKSPFKLRASISRGRSSAFAMAIPPPIRAPA